MKITIKDIQEISFQFALTAVNLRTKLDPDSNNYILGEFMKSATAIGMHANMIKENSSPKVLFNAAQSALKPLKACDYWLKLIEQGKLIDKKEIKKVRTPLDKILEMLEGKSEEVKGQTRIGFGS